MPQQSGACRLRNDMIGLWVPTRREGTHKPVFISLKREDARGLRFSFVSKGAAANRRAAKEMDEEL